MLSKRTAELCDPVPIKHASSVCRSGADDQLCSDVQVKDSLKLMMGNVHAKVTAACQEYFEKFRRHVYVTPKSYLSFIAGYKALYDKKRSFVQQLATSINSGLAKMNEAKLDVGKMKVSFCTSTFQQLLKDEHTRSHRDSVSVKRIRQSQAFLNQLCRVCCSGCHNLIWLTQMIQALKLLGTL